MVQKFWCGMRAVSNTKVCNRAITCLIIRYFDNIVDNTIRPHLTKFWTKCNMFICPVKMFWIPIAKVAVTLILGEYTFQKLPWYETGLVRNQWWELEREVSPTG
jgi:hypothetical protein